MKLLHSATLLWILSTTAAAENYIPIRNIALQGRATQSSIYSGTTSAINAIDGNLNSNFHLGSCSCTNAEGSPWWRVDLLRPHQISHIVITNRGDCCGERLNGAKLLVGDSLENNGNNNPSCAEITNIPNGGTTTFQCNNMAGQYVNIILPGKNTYLQLCEVQVFGVPESKDPLCF
ncbi:fucolectin-4-like [Rhinoderma darwinii]